MFSLLFVAGTMAASLLLSGWSRLAVGTRSVLGGAHCWFIHPWFVAWSWYTLHGTREVRIGSVTYWTMPGEDGEVLWLDCEVPGAIAHTRGMLTSIWSPILWLAFWVHDLGYWGKTNMDGPEGELHPYWGAKVLRRVGGAAWHDFVLLHSRFLARQLDRDFSLLCVADKLAICLTPAWLYLPMVRRTGEIHEYMKLAKENNDAGFAKYATMNLATDNQRSGYRDVQDYVRRWVAEHKDGRPDTWTPKGDRVANTKTGVFQ